MPFCSRVKLAALFKYVCTHFTLVFYGNTWHILTTSYSEYTHINYEFLTTMIITNSYFNMHVALVIGVWYRTMLLQLSVQLNLTLQIFVLIYGMLCFKA